MKYIRFLYVIGLLPGLAIANSMPEGFENFFSLASKNIDIMVAGSDKVLPVSALVNFELMSVKDSNEIKKIRQLLKLTGVKSSTIDVIMSDITKGVTTNNECKISYDTCMVSLDGLDAAYVYDYERGFLRIILSPDAIVSDNELVYESGFVSSYDAINWSRLNLSTNLDDNDYATWSNNTKIGLPLGFIEADTVLSSSTAGNDVNKLFYAGDFESYRLLVGRNRYNFSINSTDFLSYGAQYSGDSAWIGSSANLINTQKTSLQNLDFFSPDAGVVELLRDGNLIYSEAIVQGKHSINYSKLPSGVYDITINIKVAGEVVYTDNRTIVNNNQFSLSKGGFDFLIGGGNLTNNHWQDKDGYQSQYIKGNVVYRALNEVNLGVGISTDFDDIYYQYGMQYNSSLGFRAELVGGYFDNKDLFNLVNLSYGAFSLDYKDFHKHTKSIEKSYSQVIYGQSGFTSGGINFSGNIASSSLYARYGWYVTEGFDSNRSFTIGGFTPLYQGNLSYNLNLYPDNNDGKVQFNTTWQYPLSDNFNVQLSLFVVEGGVSNNTNYINYHNSDANSHYAASTGVKIDNDNNVSSQLSLSGQSTNKYSKLNGYGYLDSEGVSNINVGIEGGQLLSGAGVNFTNQQSNSYMVINTDKSEQYDDLLYVKEKNAHYLGQKKITSDSEVIPLDSFSEYRLFVESSDGNSYVKDREIFNGYTLPGSVYNVSLNPSTLNSSVIVLDDLYDNPVLNAQCIGSDCIMVEPLSNDGVYRVSYLGNKVPKLTSSRGVCLVNNDTSNTYKQGYCLPGVELELAKVLSDSIETSNEGELLYYLGAFSDDGRLKKVMEEVRNIGLQHRAIEVDDITYIYVMDNSVITARQKEQLKELGEYVSLLDANGDFVGILNVGDTY